ncbi:alpha/beta hydrolase [uncultured Clostridium sp.]|uniref:intracellular short-chain-length polyhydroxyalkanoate depolymerase n=1 Tax=uncultured Clostridium sp. TaxID=59620 RepID=UPI0028EF7361|nr:alpha/beta hydrolase [uncultured Clostridium sp.]
MIQQYDIKTIKISNGEVIGYREAGCGNETILLIHGNMTSSKHWDLLMDKLTPKYKIYAVDLRGFGASSYNNRVNSLRDFSEDVNDFCEKIGVTNAIVIGWSTGGGVAMYLAADHGDKVKELVLVESVGVKGYPIFRKNEEGKSIIGDFLKTKEEIEQDSVQVAPVLKAIENRDKEFYRALWNHAIYTHNKPEDDRYEEYLEDMLTQRNLVDVDYSLIHFNITEEFNGISKGDGAAKRIEAPTLIFQGDRDYVVPHTMAEDIKKHIKNSEMILLKDCGHSPFVDSLDELCEKINSFIK